MEIEAMNMFAAWLLTIVVHGGVMLLAAWAVDRAFPALRDAWRETLWRTALFGCVITATLQVASGQMPLSGRWQLSAPAQSVAAIDARRGDIMTVVASNPWHAAAPAPASAAGSASPAQAIASATKYTLPQPAARRWPLWIALFWLSGALITLGGTVLNVIRLRRALDAARRVDDPALAASLSSLAEQSGGALPRLYSLAGIPSPIAAHGRRIVLPMWAIDTLDHAQLQAMLAHEFAHIMRRDPEWKLLTAFWRALFWFVPAAAVAQRRLDELAELSCDAFAAQSLGNVRGLAECLAVCAERHLQRRALKLAPAMAARQSSLLFRIERLLEGVSMDTCTSAGGAARVVAITFVLACAAGLPAIGFEANVAHAEQAPQSKAAKHDNASHISIHGDINGKDTMTVSFSDDEHKFSAQVEGKIDFNDEETDVLSLSTGGTARLEETRGGITERIELAARADKIERRYFVNDSEHPYDDKARALMATAVKEMVRTGMNAEARAKRMYAKGGAKLVLDEIEQIHTDYVRRIYLEALTHLGKLTPGELDRAVHFAGGMSSDYERRQALDAIFDKQVLDAGRQVTFLQQALHFDTDYERAELLVGVIPRLADSDQVRQAWLDAALGVHSDYERRRTMQAMLVREGLNDAQLGSIIEASGSMSSDYEHRELLATAAHRIHDVDAVAPVYTRSVQSIAADYERREALLALINAGKLGSKSAGAVLDSAAQMHTAYECREVLTALARVMPDDANLIAHYHEVATHLPEYERAEAERALRR